LSQEKSLARNFDQKTRPSDSIANALRVADFIDSIGQKLT
jgi:hypothetical protein